MNKDTLPVIGTVEQIFRSRGIGPMVPTALDCVTGLVNYIIGAQKSITFAIYSLTSLPIATSLITAHGRGIEMLGIADNAQWGGKESLAQRCKDNGIDIERAIRQHACMHLKVAIIDEEIIALGSFNWTDRAENKNDEVLLVIRSKDTAVILKDQIMQARQLNKAAME